MQKSYQNIIALLQSDHNAKVLKKVEKVVDTPGTVL